MLCLCLDSVVQIGSEFQAEIPDCTSGIILLFFYYYMGIQLLGIICAGSNLMHLYYHCCSKDVSVLCI